MCLPWIHPNSRAALGAICSVYCLRVMGVCAHRTCVCERWSVCACYRALVLADWSQIFQPASFLQPGCEGGSKLDSLNADLSTSTPNTTERAGKVERQREREREHEYMRENVTMNAHRRKAKVHRRVIKMSKCALEVWWPSWHIPVPDVA